MRHYAVMLFSLLLASCSMSPPKPPECQGEFRPLNIPASAAKPLTHAENVALCFGEKNSNA